MKPKVSTSREQKFLKKKNIEERLTQPQKVFLRKTTKTGNILV